ncbi:unnamed protein product [Rotaria sordida]|uniref:RING-type domain-containing protein n=1 Tax=Rotaria sordida TaxID=392033 RepID=A0A819NH42_9BILA|nr:unnamed protein product [Rotaria sordida]
MATTGIIQIRDSIKQSSLHRRCSSVSKTKRQQKTIISGTDIPQQEFIIEKKKYSLNESESIQEIRIRSLSHWPHFTPSNESMASAGWFSCNVNDRVICIYCNTICHEWTINDDPAEVHKRLAPLCPFVRSMSSIVENSPKISNNIFDEKFQPFHSKMVEISRREATFSNVNWTENSPSIESLVRAGFFFAGIGNLVTCFYCNGSLHKWSSNDNPIIEHARWFPHCIYAKHLCGNQLYEKIQTSKKKLMLIKNNKIDPDQLTRLVKARLDLPIVEHLRLQYSLVIIKRCIEDQFKIKNDDFKTDIDLTMACLILQKQIDIIKGSIDNLIIPSKSQQLDNSSQLLKQSLGECYICLTEEKQLACMPCGHLCACVPCGYALRSCPICRQNIQCFIRITS